MITYSTDLQVSTIVGDSCETDTETQLDTAEDTQTPKDKQLERENLSKKYFKIYVN